MDEQGITRRSFIKGISIGGATLYASKMFGNPLEGWAAKKVDIGEHHDKTHLKKIQIIDAHAHPDRYVHDSREIDTNSTLKSIKTLGMVASSFAAIGDSVFLSQDRVPGTEYHSTKTQLEWWLKGIVKSGKVKLVLKASDVPTSLDAGSPPGAILAIEGGDALKGNPDIVNEFYGLGVRMITLIHYRNNKLGDTMRMWKNLSPGPPSNGLTPAGRKVVERMQDLGMVVDVAHAHTITLNQIVEISSRPLVDSHTNPCSVEDPLICGPRRLRTWDEMELIASTGGVVCTWPLATAVRKTFLDWAKEIREMKSQLGIEHVGLGTDGGGRLPALIDDYQDVSDLVQLVAAMQDIGFSHHEIEAYMGGNLFRVIKQCIG